jgi:small subunit ribosomal protein S6
MTRRYETVYIFDSALEEPAVNEKLERFHALLIKDGKGSITGISHWGKRTLAYPVKKKDTAYYVVAQFETVGELLPEYERAVKLDESVLRFLVVISEVEAKPVPVPAVAGDEDAIGIGEEDA